MATDSSPFADLPAALVDEVLAKAAAAGGELLANFRRVQAERVQYRQFLVDRELVLHESVLGYPPLPTTCAADGSYAIERLLSADLATAAAVAVEGLTPPSEKRHWDRPHHATFVHVEPHHAETATVLRSLMLGHELLLATRAPHDLVMLDMTLTLPVIYFNQALSQAPRLLELRCAQDFVQDCCAYLDAYRTLLWSQRSDKQYVGIPKYSTRRELGTRAGWPPEHDDRSMLTLLLQPGELTRPLPLEQPQQPWHLGVKQLPAAVAAAAADLAHDIVAGLGQVHVFYYKPHDWLPALRVEVGRDVAANLHRLAVVVQGLKHQCAVPSMLEPYPLYLADRTVKAVARAVPAFRQVATQQVAAGYEGNISDVFMAMHGYRSETG